MSWQGKVAVVTGASSGIGAEVAQVIVDAALTKNGDVYTIPGASDRVLGYFKQLSSS